jgi:DNA phosphorothioation-associated putative methyltransferase
MAVVRERAALRRRTLSRPLQLALADGLVTPETSVFDYGCGHGDDVRALQGQGVQAAGWDPALAPNEPKRSARVVNLGYVLNVIEDVEERSGTLRRAWELAEDLLLISVRTVQEKRAVVGERLGDGVLTRRSTFQKFFDPMEALTLVESTLDAPAIAVAPGVYYVFRDRQKHESYLAARVCRRTRSSRVRLTPSELYERHVDALAPVVEFLAHRGRWPAADELANFDEVVARLGSFARARQVVTAVTPADTIETAAAERTEDLLVYLALSRFKRRPRFGQLPPDLQRDIRALFQSYERACALADEVLLSVGSRHPLEAAFRASPVGKLTPSALYIHESAAMDLPPLLRIYEGCARHYVGRVDGANIWKLHRDAPSVSYLSYPKFDVDPHPALSESLLVGLQSLRIDHRAYVTSTNPPILHRKETFVRPDYPKRALFARLTHAEERAGLLDDAREIGTRNAWDERLQDRGFAIRGHRLLVAPAAHRS